MNGGFQEEIHDWKFGLEEEKVFKNYKDFGGEIKILSTFREKFNLFVPTW